MNASVEIVSEFPDEEFDIIMPESLNEIINESDHSEQVGESNDNSMMMEEELSSFIDLSESIEKKRDQVAEFINKMINYYKSIEGDTLKINF